MHVSKGARVTIPLFTLLLTSSLCIAGCSTTEQTDGNQAAHTNPTANNQSMQKNSEQATDVEPDSSENTAPNAPSVDYTDGIATLDGVSVDIPDGLILSDIQDGEARWSDGSDRHELRISSVKTSAPSSDITQRKVLDCLNSTVWNYIGYKGNSVLVCETGRHGSNLNNPALSDVKDEASPYEQVLVSEYYTPGSKDGSFVKLAFITRYNNLAEDYEWPDGMISGILDSLQSENSITTKYDIPGEYGSSTPKIDTRELSYSYDAYWDEGRYVVDVSIDNPSFLAWSGKITVACRNSHDKIIAKETNRFSFDTLSSSPFYIYSDRADKSSRFVFSDDEVSATPTNIEITLE